MRTCVYVCMYVCMYVCRRVFFATDTVAQAAVAAAGGPARWISAGFGHKGECWLSLRKHLSTSCVSQRALYWQPYVSAPRALPLETVIGTVGTALETVLETVVC